MAGLGITSRLSKELREVLKAECEKNEACLMINLDSHTSQADIFKRSADHRYGPYASATFCLMPGGDFPTRKAVVDSLLAGCIPVSFHLYTAIEQMHWNW